MSGFPAQAARVRDAKLPLRRRLLALRECVLHFAPYGFRATWHHLVVNAGLPAYLAEDADSLVRAVDELEEARRLWLAVNRTGFGSGPTSCGGSSHVTFECVPG